MDTKQPGMNVEITAYSSVKSVIVCNCVIVFNVIYVNAHT